MKPLLLASKSLSRKDLLERIGVNFIVYPSNIIEVIDKTSPIEYIVEYLATKKAINIAENKKGFYVIGTDSLLLCNGEILGKPKDFNDCISIIKKIQGRKHELYTGLCLVDSDTMTYHGGCDKTTVKFKELDDASIRGYVEKLSPYSFAGCYEIEGRSAGFIEAIEGNYTTVIGLPLILLDKFLKRFGCSLLDYQKFF